MAGKHARAPNVLLLSKEKSTKSPFRNLLTEVLDVLNNTILAIRRREGYLFEEGHLVMIMVWLSLCLTSKENYQLVKKE